MADGLVRWTVLRAWLAAALVVAGAAPSPAAPNFDAQNPVDMHGPDGMAFTPDDPLIAQGGHFQTAMMADAYGHKVGGTADGALKDTMSLDLVSWNPESGVVQMCPIYGGNDPSFRPGGPPSGLAAWKVEPQQVADQAEFFYFPSTADPRAPKPPAGARWWNGGKNVRASLLRLHGWEYDGRFPNDPSLRICPSHMRDCPKYIKAFEVEKTRLDVAILSALNMENGECGICARAFCKVSGVKIVVDGPYETKIEPFVTCRLRGTLTNTSLSIRVRIRVLGLPVTITYKLDPDIAVEIVEKCRKALNDNTRDLPPLSPLMPADLEQRIRASFNTSPPTPVDTIANELMQAALRTGSWLPWVATNDPLLRDQPSLDVSGTPLAGPRATTAQALPNPSASNNAMSFCNEEVLLYGRDTSTNPTHCRLIEWFVATWLCVNLTILDPYGDGDASGKAKWDYRDLIVAGKPLTPDTIPVEWPPKKQWNGGQGSVLFGQAAYGHAGGSGGSDLSPGNPGNPKACLAALVTLTPGAVAPGAADSAAGAKKAAYNVLSFGLTVGSAPINIPWADDPLACSPQQVVPWPPINATTGLGPIKWLNANVANGHDRKTASGQFMVGWDIGADGSVDTAWGNVGFPTASANQAFFFVRDTVTKRTGFHQVDLVP